MTLLADVVATSAAVAATRSRTAKVEALAGLLVRLGREELPLVARWLAGRTQRLDVGWAALRADPPAPTAQASLEVADVAEALAALAAASGTGSQAARRAMLDELLGRATAEEQAFTRRLLLGELRQGALEGLVLQALAAAFDVPESAVRRAAMLLGDLGATAEVAAAGADALAAVGLEVLRPVQPMLAATAGSVAEALDALGTAMVEHKLDGARIQVHVAADEVRVFTRNLNDVTDRNPEAVAAARALRVRAAILDGEALVVGDDDRPRAFQDTMSRFGRERDLEAASLSPFFFDVLHLDGRDLLDAPLAQRREALVAVVPAERLVPGRVVEDAGAAAEVLRAALAAGHEGVMVKALDAPYAAGRRGAAWRKVKPVHTLDLVVLAVEWGSGRRRGWLSNIHLGARDGDGFVMLGKTFKGMTDAMLQWQTRRFLELESHREGHVVHVRPEQVVEVAIDGVQTSSRYPGGVALRFARVVRYRDDKAPEEADTLATVRAIQQGARLPDVR